MSCIKHCVPICVSMCIGIKYVAVLCCASANILLHPKRFSDVLLSLKAESDANSDFTG